MPTMKTKPEWLRATFTSRPKKVDREANVLRGYVLAQEGIFKSEGRGQFDRESLNGIMRLGNDKRKGLKARFTHPDASADGLGKFLGRAKNLYIDRALNERTGDIVPAVRGDLHFDQTALESPPGGGGKPYGNYVMDLADSDPDAFSSSLVIQPDRFIPDGKGGLTLLDDDEEAPDGVTPLWRPAVLHASDIVDTGDAVDSVLSADLEGLDIEGLPLSALWNGAEMLDSVFAKQPREVVEKRVQAFLSRYLDRRYGERPSSQPTPTLDARRIRLQEAQLALAKLHG